MRRFLLILVVLLLAPGPLRAAETSPEIRRAIEQVIAEQVTSWNAGDHAGFMKGYLKSDDILFLSGNDITRGWATVLARYQKRYPDKATMGRLTLGDLEFNALGPDTVLVVGRWKVETKKHKAQKRRHHAGLSPDGRRLAHRARSHELTRRDHRPMRVRRLGVLLALGLLATGGCRPPASKTLPIQDARAKPIEGAFGRKLGERWPDLAPGAEPVKRSDLFVFQFTPPEPMRGVSRYRAWVLPATMAICRLTGAGDFKEDAAFADFFQELESQFGHLAPLSPAESFKPPDRQFWSVTREGRTVLLVRRKDGRTTIDLFDTFLGSRPLEEILSAKGAQDSDS